MRKAFIDSSTRLLKCHGTVETNETGDIALLVPDGFNLEPGFWRWDGTQWVAHTPPPRTRRQRVQSAGEVLQALINVLAVRFGVSVNELLSEIEEQL